MGFYELSSFEIEWVWLDLMLINKTTWHLRAKKRSGIVIFQNDLTLNLKGMQNAFHFVFCVCFLRCFICQIQDGAWGTSSSLGSFPVRFN